MSSEEALFQLNKIFIEHIKLEHASDEEIEGLDDIEIDINLLFDDAESEYKNDGIVRIKHDISGFYMGVKLSIVLISEIFVKNNESSLNEMIDESMAELAKPGLNRASILISPPIESFIQFPVVIDFYEMYKEFKEKNKN
ncbi:hypothetical protein IGJ74_001833 [Enterococcus sp. AZ009]|uniref:hypothetical protein n=1 Tax=Enterococcus TaxID=1350 RepID=UPI001C4820EB|nr:hypothetical protein [Enterococcus casseliflavus]